MKNELGGKILTKFVGLKVKTYSYLIDHGSEDKKAKSEKEKKKLKFENYKNCLEATQLENKINHLEKNEINVDSLKKGHKEFIINQWINIKNKACVYSRN